MRADSGNKLPILYSFRRCPYAIRARMAIAQSDLSVELREVVLKNKPASMLEYSSKGTVPVLVLEDGTVIDESLDVMKWALSMNDSNQWLAANNDPLIEENDHVFKKHLDHYKYADRFPENPMEHYREQALNFIIKLNSLLEDNKYLCGGQVSMTDVAIFPFIRQFAFVDKDWFDQLVYSNLQCWLEYFLNSVLFLSVMKKYKPWVKGNQVITFPE